MKKSVVTIAMAAPSVETGRFSVAGATFELAMDIASWLSPYSI
jgi:ribosomal protein S7